MDIRISVIVLTYNHEKYIEQALESILMQKVNVPYEILIIDDASLDSTRDILIQYQKKYPEQIRLYLRKHNSCHPTQNSYYLFSKARGDYFAFLEGDDFWIDSKKLQTQFDFMEEHCQYSACVCDCEMVDDYGESIPGVTDCYYKKKSRVYTLNDLKKMRLPGQTGSLFARNNFGKGQDYSIVYKASPTIGDFTFVMLSVMEADIYQLPMKMTAHRRIVKEGNCNFSSRQDADYYAGYIQLCYWNILENYISKKHHVDFHFDGKDHIFLNVAKDLPLAALWKLIQFEGKKGRYLRLALAAKLSDSRFIYETSINGSAKSSISFSGFCKDTNKRPLIIFGAGNVCREFLEHYEYAFHVLFLVDNDPKKQGSSYKGFLVRKPEELAGYHRKNPVILVANENHEDEIGKQLEKMGVTDYYFYCRMKRKKIRNRIAQRIAGRLDRLD